MKLTLIFSILIGLFITHNAIKFFYFLILTLFLQLNILLKIASFINGLLSYIARPRLSPINIAQWAAAELEARNQDIKYMQNIINKRN